MGARENIRVADPNFTTDGDYFYCLLDSAGVLQAKADDGTVAFSYPCDTAIGGTVNSLSWDGVYFWSLEDKSGGVIIRKWAIDSYLAKQQVVYNFSDGGGHTYSSNDMAVESYCLSVGDNDNGGGGYTMNMSVINVSDTSMMSPGDVLTFVKRRTPTQSRYGTTSVETAIVDSVLSATSVELTANMTGDPYTDGKGFRGPSATFGGSEPTPPDLVYVTKSIWMLNDNAPNDPTTGAVYKINSATGSNIVQYSGSQYTNIKGAAFYTKYNVAGTFPYAYNTTISSDEQYLLFVNGSSLLFYSVETLAVVKSISLNNVKADLISVWDVFDLAVSGHEPNVSLFRLQSGTTYGDPLSNESWSSVYSYEKTLLARVVHSIAVTAEPSILPADGTTTSAITAIVRDQYNNPVQSKTVNWADDAGGRLSPVSSVTDVFGRANTTYTATDTEDDVKITASVANGLV